MTSPSRILIIDDDPDFVLIYREMFAAQGLSSAVAHSSDEAIRYLESTAAGDVDIVLLDQKLQGPGGPDSGLDLIARIQSLAPLAKTIVVTGYASPGAIERAFKLGVYDYLVKNGAFDALLSAKVRNAAEVTAERRLAALSKVAMQAQLESTWRDVQTETDRNRKGQLLEQLVKLLFRATPGFEQVSTRVDNQIEEIDIVVANRSEDPLWKGDGSSYLLGECKNWSSTCGSREFRDFHAKLTTKYQRARTGFFIAPGAFTSEFFATRLQHARDHALVIPVDKAALERWIRADDRLLVLRELHQKAVFDLPATT